MMKKTFSKVSISDLKSVAMYLKSEIDNGNNLFLFRGNLGAGKTTLIKEFGKQLQVVDTMSSPTYALVNSYQTESNETVHHFDLYRLEQTEELDSIGFEEYLISNQVVLIEWPEIAQHILDDYTTVDVYITGSAESRDIEIK